MKIGDGPFVAREASATLRDMPDLNHDSQLSPSLRQRQEYYERMQAGMTAAATAFAWQSAKHFHERNPHISAAGLVDLLFIDADAAEKSLLQLSGDQG